VFGRSWIHPSQNRVQWRVFVSIFGFRITEEMYLVMWTTFVWSWLPLATGVEYFLKQLCLPLTHAELVHTSRVSMTLVEAMLSRKHQMGRRHTFSLWLRQKLLHTPRRAWWYDPYVTMVRCPMCCSVWLTYCIDNEMQHCSRCGRWQSSRVFSTGNATFLSLTSAGWIHIK
jgi:hypothetical protein